MFKRRINWKAIGCGFTWLISLSGLIVLMSFIDDRKNTTTCKTVKVDISGPQRYIERWEVNKLLTNGKSTLIGKPLRSLNIHQIEQRLQSNPFIEHAKVYTDIDGTMWVQIKQREPVLRVLNAFNQSFYIDRNGLKMPVSNTFTANVLVANGYIMESFSNKIDTLKTPLAKDLFKTALLIEKDTLWSQQIEQLYISSHADIELVPRVGNHRIILGSADSLETKLNNLLVFYKKALPKCGWNTYKTINLKYSNQIVCEKAITDSTSKATKQAISSTASLSSTKKI